MKIAPRANSLMQRWGGQAKQTNHVPDLGYKLPPCNCTTNVCLGSTEKHPRLSVPCTQIMYASQHHGYQSLASDIMSFH